MRADSTRPSSGVFNPSIITGAGKRPQATADQAAAIGPPPFRASLEQQGIKHQCTGDSAYHACLGQAVLFSAFYDKVEHAELRPADEEYQELAIFHLEKASELIAALEPKLRDACKAVEDLVPLSASALSKEQERHALALKNGLITAFETIKRDLAEAREHPDRLRLTREKAAYLFVVNAVLTDTARAMVTWAHKISHQALSYSPSVLGSLEGDNEKAIRTFFTDAFVHTPFFVSETLSDNERDLLHAQLVPFSHLDKQWVASVVVPVFSQSGAFGLAAGLYATCNNRFVITAPTKQLHSAHQGAYKHHLESMKHDCGHMAAMYSSNVIRPRMLGEPIGSGFRDIFLQVLSVRSTASIDATKQDEILLFYLLQDNSGVFNPSFRSKSFLHSAQAFYVSLHLAADVIPLLRKLGFTVPPTRAEGGLDDSACLSAVAKSMETIWLGFRERHNEQLKRHGIHKRFPTWFEKT